MSGVEYRSSMDGKDYGKALQAATEAALQKAGIIVEAQAVALAPRDTGRLKGSITYRTRSGGSTPREPAGAGDVVSAPLDNRSVHIGTGVNYAQHQEYGTVRMSAQPFLRPALHMKKGDILRDFQKWVQEHLKRGK